MLRFVTAGESHGQALIAWVSGLPAGVRVDLDFIQRELHRRQLGYGRGGRQRIEKDAADILAGVRHGKTIGAPIAVRIENRDWKNWEKTLPVEEVEDTDGADASDPKSAQRQLTAPRPGHADLAGALKFNLHDARYVLERASARETAARVAAGAFAKLLLREFGVEVLSHSIAVGHARLERAASWEEIVTVCENLESPLRCVDADTEARMKAEVDEVMRTGDSVGGIFEVVAHGIPPGLGSHAQWDEKLDARIARAVMSIQAVKAVEIRHGRRECGELWIGSAGRDSLRCGEEKIRADVESRGRARRRDHERQRRGGARISETDFNAATAVAYGGLEYEGSGEGGVRAFGRVRGSGGRRGGRGDGGGGAGRSVSRKIRRRFDWGDAQEFRGVSEAAG